MLQERCQAQSGVHRLALVLRPERNLQATLEEIRAWAAATGVALVGTDSGLTLAPRTGVGPQIAYTTSS